MPEQNVYMKGRDVISAKLAECYVTHQGRRYNFGQMIDLEVTFEKNKSEVDILGKLGTSHKTYGWSGAFSGNMHFNQSVFRRMLLEYKNTGIDPYFEMQITNHDPQSPVGRQTIIIKDCNLDSGLLAAFDAAGEDLQESVEGTYEDFQMPEEFAEMVGF